MAALTYILTALAVFCIFFLVLPFLTTLATALKGKETTKSIGQARAHDFGVIITAYRNANITKPLIESLLRQTHQRFVVYLVADNCEQVNFSYPNNDRVVILQPDPALNLKAKSLIYAMEHFRRDHDYVVVCDADNLAHPKFLEELNHYANAGYLAIQGQRTAKNINSPIAAADAVGEFYKNYIERYGAYRIGSSAVISGSGMAVERELYWAYLMGPDITAGKEKWKKMLQEDKILQNFLLRKNHKIAYAWNAIIYDEKVSDGDAVETQRSRWLYSYFQNIPNSLGILRRGITGLKWNQLFFGLVTIAPPLFIHVGLSLIVGIVCLIAGLSFGESLLTLVGSACMAALWLFAANVIWTLQLSRAPKALWANLNGVPLFIARQMTALLRMGNPNKNFKHTEHKVEVSIDEVLGKS
jgi:cellulose synthase/poly-beta-1,6-N-acetylglucosamine synthase-like glycosyltransferase